MAKGNWGKMSSAAKEHLRRIALERGYRPPVNGKRGYRHSPKTIAKMQEAHRGHSTRRGSKWTPAQHAKYRKSMEPIRKSPEYQAKARAGRLRQKFPSKMTTLEQALRNEFKKRRLKFEMHKTMFGRFQPDFVFETVKLIVQADGDYWHRIKEGRLERDARFNAAAHAAGWTVWRFAESEIVQHPQACGRAVARFVRSH